MFASFGRPFTFCLSLLILVGCSGKNNSESALFEEMISSETGIDFENNVTSTDEFNIFNYRNFYNGGGVAIGDINNDNLPDIFLIANQGINRLFLNKGNFRFEDITESAGVGGTKSWSTGATFADVNGDGFLDLYVCNAGRSADHNNELFINNGKGKFTEQAQTYGLADKGYSTHAAFFDYDRDGDLDMYLLNNSFMPVGQLGYANLRNKRDPDGGHKLFRNDGAHFTDVSEQAGIFGSVIGFGLGTTVGDVNNDNWPDIYVCNDFYEHDYLYINNHDGTFKESIQAAVQHTSLSSMGADIADINNDGKLDIYVTDMLPGNDRRLKLTSTFEGYNLMRLKVSRDFYYQYMQNTLQLNQTDDSDGKVWFSEIARFTGTAATDWSWGALLFDMDADGQKDIFVANGISKDLTNQDFVQFLANPSNIAEISRAGKFDYKVFLDKMPSEPVPNYAFRNTGGLNFENKATEWGLGTPGFSNGAAYGDLDNDGDLDLVVNNANSQVSIFRNKVNQQKDFHYLKFKLAGETGNPNGIGAKVFVHQKDKVQMLQQMPNRGFQSSVDLRLVFGLRGNVSIDSVTVIWPDDRMQVLGNLAIDSTYTLQLNQADRKWTVPVRAHDKMFVDVTTSSGINFEHKEADYVDYNDNPLIKQMYSRLGPAVAVGDVDGDGLEDVYVGGAVGQGGRLYRKNKNGNFSDQTPQAIRADTTIEATDAVFFDADGDKDLDLIVVSGSNEFTTNSDALLPRVYLNDGKGGFSRSGQMRGIRINASSVAVADVDGDGDMDIFLGGRLKSRQYGLNPESYLLVNDGTGKFTDRTKLILPQNNQLGMVTDAAWADLNGDSYPELVVVGDWMPVMIFSNQQGKLLLQDAKQLHDGTGKPYKTNGWWNTVQIADVNGDGNPDIIAGNLGLNSRLKASQTTPVEMFVKDFDQNGVVKQIITCPDETGESYPTLLKPDLLRAMPSLKKKFVKYEQYAGKKLDEVLTSEDIESAVRKSVYTGESAILFNEKKGQSFRFESLPGEAQFAPVNSIVAEDYDQDGAMDLMIAGNNFDVLPEMGRYDAARGLILTYKNKKWLVRKPGATGFYAEGQIRNLRRLSDGQVILGRNNAGVQVYRQRATKR